MFNFGYKTLNDLVGFVICRIIFAFKKTRYKEKFLKVRDDLNKRKNEFYAALENISHLEFEVKRLHNEVLVIYYCNIKQENQKRGHGTDKQHVSAKRWVVGRGGSRGGSASLEDKTVDHHSS